PLHRAVRELTPPGPARSRLDESRAALPRSGACLHTCLATLGVRSAEMAHLGHFSNALAFPSFPQMVRSTLGALVIVAATLAAALPAAAVEDTRFHSAWVGQDSWPTLAPGMTVSYSLRFRNTGTTTWQRGVAGRQVNLGVVDDSTAFAEMAVGWMSANRTATTVEATVAPGAIGTFTFTIRSPSRLGVYRLPLRPVADGVTWLEHQGVF